jgi:hypothetical protein
MDLWRAASHFRMDELGMNVEVNVKTAAADL